MYKFELHAHTAECETMTLWQVIGGVWILGFTLWNEIVPKQRVRN